MIPIRKGDGTGLSVPGVSQVRTGDGRVLFNVSTPNSVVDDFEDGDIGEYRGSTSNFTTTTTNTIEGTYSLRCDSSAGEAIWSIPGDGLANYPDEGSVVSWLIRDANNTHPAFCLNVEDSPTRGCYAFAMSEALNAIKIFKVADLTNLFNSESELNAANPTINSGDWYLAEANLPTSSDNSISFSLYEQSGLERGNKIASVSANDNEFAQSRGVGVYTRGSDTTKTILDVIKTT